MHAGSLVTWPAGLPSPTPTRGIGSDAFAAYREATDLAFAPYAKYGQLIKDHRNAKQPGRYAPPEIVHADRRGIFGIREHEEARICTSRVERHNWTVRTLLKRFTRS